MTTMLLTILQIGVIYHKEIDELPSDRAQIALDYPPVRRAFVFDSNPYVLS